MHTIRPYAAPTTGIHDWLRWDDLRFPAQEINPVGPGSPPTVDSATGLLKFVGNQDNVIAGCAQMPHAWARGTTVSPHLHVVAPANTGFNSRWEFAYNRGNNQANLENPLGTYTASAAVTVANPNNAQRLFVVEFPDLVMAGYIESACILWRIARLAASDALDTDTTDWTLAEFDIHFQTDKMGSILEFPT